jgi:hypothetical protein
VTSSSNPSTTSNELPVPPCCHASRPTAKRAAKRQAEESVAAAEPEAKPDGRGRRGAVATDTSSGEQAPAGAARGGRGRGGKRAAEAEPAPATDAEQAPGRSKRGRAAAPKPSGEAAPSSRTQRGRPASSGDEVSTRGGRAHTGAAHKAEAAAQPRSTRSRR